VIFDEEEWTLSGKVEKSGGFTIELWKGGLVVFRETLQDREKVRIKQ